MSSAVRSLVLQDDQKFTLMKFRRSVADILKPDHDDHYLIRWLNARQWNLDAAETMLRDSKKWRDRGGFDDIANWKPPQVLLDYSPHGLSGFDKGGSPLIIIPFAGLDMYGMLHSVSRADFIRATIQSLEYYTHVAYEQSKTHGPGARQCVILFDMKDFHLKQYTWRPAGEVIITLIKTYEANYPEVLKCCYIINVPKVFVFVFNIVKKFLDEYTISKIFLFNNGSKKWQSKMLEHVDASQLPKIFGGTMTDPDGNPKCLTKLNYGGKIPTELYIEKCDTTNGVDYTDTVIKKGGQIQMSFNCSDTSSILKWEFKTFNHDIRFGVKRKNNLTGEVNEEIELGRVASHQLEEEGCLTMLPDCTYTVLFDNTYSYFTNKRIVYAVGVTSSVDIDELEQGSEALDEL